MGLDTLCDLYETLTITQSVVFCNTDSQISFLQDQLKKRDFAVSVLHADMDKGTHEQTVREFRSGSSRIMICRDLREPPFDIQQISLYIHFDIAPDVESYIRRFRCIPARFRTPGRDPAVMLVSNSDLGSFQSIQDHLSTPIPEMPMDIGDYI